MSNSTLNTFDHAGLIQPIYKAIWAAGGKIYNSVEAIEDEAAFKVAIVGIAGDLRASVAVSRRLLEDQQQHRMRSAGNGIRIENPRSHHFEIVSAKVEEIASDLTNNLLDQVPECFAEQDFTGFLDLAFDMTGMDPAQVVHQALAT